MITELRNNMANIEGTKAKKKRIMSPAVKVSLAAAVVAVILARAMRKKTMKNRRISLGCF